nr:MAG TPA: minor tail protein [Caudoviricetes sp.]
MDFQAVIKAILNKGDVESQLADLVKDRDVHINPTVGTSGSTNTTLNNQIKRQANAQAKSYVQYSKSAIQKQMKHASGTFYSSGETNIDKGLISRQKKQAEEMASVITDIAKNEGISDKDAKKYAKNVSKIQEKAQDQALKEQEKNNAKFQAKQKALNEKAAKIESDIQAKKFASKSSKYQKQFSGYVDNNSKEYNEFGMNVIDYDKQRKELNRMYGNFQKNRSAENRDLLIEAHAKLEQYDKNTASSLSLLNASPNKVLQSDVQKQVEKQHKEQEKQYSNWFNQALKEQEKKDSYVENVSRNLGNKSYDANLAAQQNKLNSYYAGTQEYKNASKSFKEYEKNVQDLQKLHTQYQAKPTTANQDAIIQQNEKVIQSYEKLNNEMKILNSTQTKALNPGEGSIQANKIRTYLENNTKAAKDYGDVLEDIAKKSESATTKGELQGANQDFKKIQSEISARGLTGNSMFSEVKRGFSQISQFVGTYGILQSGMNKAQEMVQNTYDVDSAMTQLQMATGVSNDKAKDLMKTYSNMGHQLKATGTDVAASSTEWMKQGQSVEKSNKLAENSIKLSKVGDLTSENATKYLTSARKGYGITSAEDTLKIVDKMSSVDMASATDVGGLAEGMSEVATNANLAGKIDARPYGDIWAIFINSSYYPNRLKPDWAIVA